MGATVLRTKLNYNTPITVKELNIVFNGVAYENVPRIEDANKGEIYYGSATFSEYPFELLVKSNLDGIWLITNARGEYTISASIPSSTEVTTTPCFDKARGYECKEEYTLLIDESVTTVIREGRDYAAAPLASSSKVNAETVRVTFDDTEYICVGRQGFGMEYGALWSDETQSFDWSEYPFCIGSNDLGNSISTQTAGTHQVKIEALEYSIETSECFKKAVKSVGVDGGVMMLNLTGSDPLSIEGATWQEALDALQSGTMVFLSNEGKIFPCSSFHKGIIAFFVTTVDADGVYTDGYTWTPDGTVGSQSDRYPQS